MRWTVNLTVVSVMVLVSFTMMGRAADLPSLADICSQPICEYTLIDGN